MCGNDYFMFRNDLFISMFAIFGIIGIITNKFIVSPILEDYVTFEMSSRL